MYGQDEMMYWKKGQATWIDSLPYREPWNGFNVVPTSQNVGLYTFYKHPGQTWIQAHMVQVMFKHHLGINAYLIHTELIV